MKAINAKYPGTCAVSGQRYEAGTEITRTTDGKAWQLASAPAGAARPRDAVPTGTCWECGGPKRRGDMCAWCGEDQDI